MRPQNEDDDGVTHLGGEMRGRITVHTEVGWLHVHGRIRGQVFTHFFSPCEKHCQRGESECALELGNNGGLLFSAAAAAFISHRQLIVQTHGPWHVHEHQSFDVNLRKHKQIKLWLHVHSNCI